MASNIPTWCQWSRLLQISSVQFVTLTRQRWCLPSACFQEIWMQTNQHASEPLHRSLDISIPRMCPETSWKGTWRVWCLLPTLSFAKGLASLGHLPFCNEIGNLIIMSTPCSSNTKLCRKDKEGENEWQDNQGNYHHHLSLPTSFLHHHGYVFLQTSPKSQTRLVVLAFAVFTSCPAQKLTLMPWPFYKTTTSHQVCRQSMKLTEAAMLNSLKGRR